MINTGVYGNPGYPMLERDIRAELLKLGEDFQEYFLGKVLFEFAPRQVVPDDSDDDGIGLVHQLLCGCLLRPPDARDQCQHVVRRHWPSNPFLLHNPSGTD
jgi:hypothetical protein